MCRAACVAPGCCVLQPIPTNGRFAELVCVDVGMSGSLPLAAAFPLSPTSVPHCAPFLTHSPPLFPLQAENELLRVHQMQLLEKEHSGCAALLRDDKASGGSGAALVA